MEYSTLHPVLLAPTGVLLPAVPIMVQLAQASDGDALSLDQGRPFDFEQLLVIIDIDISQQRRDLHPAVVRGQGTDVQLQVWGMDAPVILRRLRIEGEECRGRPPAVVQRVQKTLI